MRRKAIMLLLVCLMLAIGSVSAFAAAEPFPDVEINAENYNQMWEIQFVGANKLDASQWVNGDAIVLNMGIKPNSVNR